MWLYLLNIFGKLKYPLYPYICCQQYNCRVSTRPGNPGNVLEFISVLEFVLEISRNVLEFSFNIFSFSLVDVNPLIL